MLLRTRDSNIQSFACIRLNKGNQMRKELKEIRMRKECVLISFIKPDTRKTFNKFLLSEK